MEYIFDTTPFMPRLHCGPGWTLTMMYTAILPNMVVLIGFLLFAVEAYVLFVYRNPNVENKLTFKFFVAALVMCGISRSTENLAFRWPAYRFFVLLDWACAICFVALCFRHRDLFNYLLNFKLFKEKLTLTEQLRVENERYMEAKTDLESSNQNLTMTVDRLQYIIKSEMWLVDKHKAVAELENLLKEIKK